MATTKREREGGAYSRASNLTDMYPKTLAVKKRPPYVWPDFLVATTREQSEQQTQNAAIFQTVDLPLADGNIAVRSSCYCNFADQFFSRLMFHCMVSSADEKRIIYKTHMS